MPKASTQKFIPIENIRNDVVVLRGGKIRSVLQVSSINLALKSQEEQEAVIYTYQNFLNSLDFPIQILINSRLMNIEGYIQNLEGMVLKQETQLLKMQTQEYINFIRRFVEQANIISTDFFIIVPYSLLEADIGKGGAGERFKSLFGKSSNLGAADIEKFQYHRSQLMQRVDFISSGLHRIGLTVNALNTKQLISLYWNIYNSKDLRKRNLIQPLFD